MGRWLLVCLVCCAMGISLGLSQIRLASANNLLQNPTPDSEAHWTLFVRQNATATAAVIDGAYCIDVRQSGDNPWSIALYQGPFAVEAGKNYLLSFDALAKPEAELGVKIGQDSPPYNEYFYQTRSLSPEMQTLTFDFELTSSDPSAQLELFMGNTLTKPPATLCFDNFYLAEADAKGNKRTVPYLMVDQFGYRPEARKVAVLIDPQEGFNAADEYVPGEVLELKTTDTAEVIFSGKPELWNGGEVQASSGDRGWWFDFSEVSEPGNYYIYDPTNDLRSYEFTIAENVYDEVLKAAVRMFYYNRANFPKEEPYADARWTDAASFVGPGQDTEARFVEDKENAATARDLSGGWFDAGDTNKYVTFAQAPVHVLLSAYEENPQAFSDDFNIPDSGNGLPDLIDELLWEFDWLKKMQLKDGGAIIKMGHIDFNGTSPLSKDERPRYYGPVCSSATIAAASMFAHGALVFGQFERLADYATDLEARAVRAYDWYLSNERRDDCDSQEIKAGDADRSLAQQDAMSAVAGVYLYALTGDERYHNAVKTHYLATLAFADSDPRWSVYEPYQGDALLYYSSLDNADPELKNIILEAKISQAQGVAADLYRFQSERDLYRAYIRPDAYHWGSNYVRASVANTNLDMVHYGLDNAEVAHYYDRALGILNYFHGVNPFNRVYLSNMYDLGAENSINELYHEWFNDGTVWDNALTSERGPAPGYLVGGPNANYSGAASPPQGEPLQKAYRDWNANAGQSWEISEPAIYYQAAYVRLLANFVGLNLTSER